MPYQIGLKLWSTNTDYYLREALRLHEAGVYDYIELYVVPGSQRNIAAWKQIHETNGIPFALHAPHFSHGLNFSFKENEASNCLLIEQTKEYAEQLEPAYTIFHPGIGGSLRESICQMKRIEGLDFLVENKPYIVPLEKQGRDEFCIGARVEDIQRIMAETGCGFCLDVGHALCCANCIGEKNYAYIEKFNSLHPAAYHISDNEETSRYDRHLHFGDGTINFQRIFEIIKPDSLVAIETNKDNRENLADFEKDVRRIKRENIYEQR